LKPELLRSLVMSSTPSKSTGGAALTAKSALASGVRA